MILVTLTVGVRPWITMSVTRIMKSRLACLKARPGGPDRGLVEPSEAREALAGADHGHGVAVARTAAQALYRARNAYRRDDPAGAIADGCADRGDARLALGHGLSPAAAPDFGKSAAGEPAARQ